MFIIIILFIMALSCVYVFVFFILAIKAGVCVCHSQVCAMFNCLFVDLPPYFNMHEYICVMSLRINVYIEYIYIVCVHLPHYLSIYLWMQQGEYIHTL